MSLGWGGCMVCLSLGGLVDSMLNNQINSTTIINAINIKSKSDCGKSLDSSLSVECLFG